MGYYYSFKTKGFYNNGIHEVPDDAVELCDGDYDNLLKGLSNLMEIVNVGGYPTLKAPPQQSSQERATAELSLRLELANQQIAILKPAVDGGYAKQEHTKLLADWQRNCYELTLVPEQADWPEKPQWPIEPDKVYG